MSDTGAPILSTPRIPVSRLTTIIAACWGVLTSYQLFHSLLVTHSIRPCVIAPVPLLTVWATLERKRWGRLALLGMSLTAICLFLTVLVIVGFTSMRWFDPTGRSIGHGIRTALRLYAEEPSLASVTLILAALSGFWLCRPSVIAEFEQGKRATLDRGQRIIATSLVACWGVTLTFTLLIFDVWNGSIGGLPAMDTLIPHHRKHHPRVGVPHPHIRRANRSAAEHKRA